jgi:hypothetical protein
MRPTSKGSLRDVCMYALTDHLDSDVQSQPTKISTKQWHRLHYTNNTIRLM